MATELEPGNFAKYLMDYTDNSEFASDKVFHCDSKITIFLGYVFNDALIKYTYDIGICRETKMYADGRCMLTNNVMIWRNTAHSDAKKQRILLQLNQIKSIAVKSDGKSFLSNAFTSPRLIVYLNETQNEDSEQKQTPSQQLYIQLSFKNGKDSRNLFAQKLQQLIASKLLTPKNEDEKTQYLDDKYETLQNIIYKENIIDEIHEKYIKITVSEFSSAIQALYYIQGHSAYQNANKIQMIRKAADIITKVVRYDDKLHHLKLNDSDRRIICDSYFNYEPYLEINTRGQILATYTEYHVGRFLDINDCIFRLFKRIYPIKVSLKVQQQWMETLLRCTWYYQNDDSQKIILLIDTLMNEIWNVKFVPLNDVNFDDKNDLSIIKHILSNYCHFENIPTQCHLQNLVQIFVQNEGKNAEYEKYLIEILNIKALRSRFTAECAHKAMVDLVIKHKYTKYDYVITEMIAYIKRCYKKNEDAFLDLQAYMKGVIDEDEALQIIELNLMINPKLIAAKWKNKYNGLNALQYAQSKEVKPTKIVTFLEEQMKEYELAPSDDEGNSDDDEKFDMHSNIDAVDLNDDTNQGVSVSTADVKKIIGVVNNLQNEISDLKKANENISALQQKIYDEIMKNKSIGNEENENKVDVDEELKQCAPILTTSWRKWTYIEIVAWIIALDGRFEKYKYVLYEKMKFREMKGIDLEMLEKTDLSNFFGINNFGDICSLYNAIQELIATKTDEQIVENE